MNCQEFWDTAPELAGETGAEALAHAAGLPEVFGPAGEPARAGPGFARRSGGMEPRESAGARGRQVACRLPRAGRLVAPEPARRWWFPAVTWSAAAAVVAAAFLLLVVRERLPRAPRNVTVGAGMAAADWSARLAAGDYEADSGGEFIPLPNAERLAPDEDVNMVRVEVPRSAMIAVGFAVPADRASELVQADVVLGSDGLARAVRFLDE